jgi:hypothetical protein
LTYKLLCAAGTVEHYGERNTSHVATFGSRFNLFEGESTAAGEELGDMENAELEALMPGEQEGEVYCVPQRLLLLAKVTEE